MYAQVYYWMQAVDEFDREFNYTYFASDFGGSLANHEYYIMQKMVHDILKELGTAAKAEWSVVYSRKEFENVAESWAVPNDEDKESSWRSDKSSPRSSSGWGDT